MQQGPEDTNVIHVRGSGTSKHARRRRNVQAQKAARAAEESARSLRLQQDRVAADEAQAARARSLQLARAARAEESQRDSELVRAAIADAESARADLRVQRDAESQLEPEAAFLSRRLAAASARAARVEALRLDSEAREAVLRAELQARQAELDELRGSSDRPSAPASTPAPAAETAVTLPATTQPDRARSSTPPLPAVVPDSRDEQIASLSFQVREHKKSAFRRSAATASEFVNNTLIELLSAPVTRGFPVSSPPAGRQPAAPPSPPTAPAPKLVLKWRQPAHSHSSAATSWARRPALSKPPWAADS
jgi:hypothetical protein